MVTAVPNLPVFTKIDLTALQKTDWTDTKVAARTVEALENTLGTNSGLRQTFTNTSLVASVERVKLMQDAAAAAKKGKDGPNEVFTDGDLKRVRDEVKATMLGLQACDATYYTAMGDFRLSSNFDFAGEYGDEIKKMRTKAQDIDKSVSATLGKVTSLEGFASGLIKEIRTLRGEITKDVDLLKKIEDAKKKSVAMYSEADTAMAKLESSMKAITNLVAHLPKTAKDVAGKIVDLDNSDGRFRKGMGAYSTLQGAVKVMIKAIERKDISGIAQGKLDEMEKAWDGLISRRDALEKDLVKMQKNKDIPKDVVKQLPKSFK